MSVELKVPSFGESVTEAYLGDWLKNEGDTVDQDEPVVVLETDKVTAELPAPTAGTITKILKKSGDTAEVGEVIGYMEAGEGSAAASSGAAGADDRSADDEKADANAASGNGSGSTDGAGDGDEEGSKKSDEREPARASGASGPDQKKASDGNKADGESGNGEVRVMPAAGRLLAEHDLAATDVPASGPGGRLLKEDVLAYLEGRKGSGRSAGNGAANESRESSTSGTGDGPKATPSPDVAGSRETERVTMTRIRQRIASRLVESQQTAALLTTFNEIDMSEVMALRKTYQEKFVDAYGVKLGFMSFFVKAAIEALKLIPAVNASIDGDEVVYHHYHDIGIAVGGGRGLVVPVIRNAERLSLAEIESTIGDFAKRAKENKLEIDELQGGTFTISNGGVYGSLLSTPIVNPPQSGILGLHGIQERPVARDGEVVIRPMMYVALTYDHRLIDGRESVTFLKRIKECVESPSRILLEI